jgi:hypothetical protein
MMLLIVYSVGLMALKVAPARDEDADVNNSTRSDSESRIAVIAGNDIDESHTRSQVEIDRLDENDDMSMMVLRTQGRKSLCSLGTMLMTAIVPQNDANNNDGLADPQIDVNENDSFSESQIAVSAGNGATDGAARAES